MLPIARGEWQSLPPTQGAIPFQLTSVVDARDGSTGSIGLGLDTETVVGVGDSVADDVHVADSDVARDGTNGNTVTTAALVVLESDVGALVDGKTVVLIHNDAETKTPEQISVQ